MKKLEKKIILLGSYQRPARIPDASEGSPCKRAVLSYAPLRETLANRKISFRTLRRNYGFSTNLCADLNQDRPIHLDALAQICYYLNLTPNDILSFEFEDSQITKADFVLRNTAKAKESPKEKPKGKAKPKAAPKKKDAPAKKPSVLFDDDEP